jgi:hypothetical protein
MTSSFRKKKVVEGMNIQLRNTRREYYGQHSFLDPEFNATNYAKDFDYETCSRQTRRLAQFANIIHLRTCN